MTKKILNVYIMVGESKDGQKYQVELVCEDGNQEQTFKNHISKIGWDQYAYKLLRYETPTSVHIDLEFKE